MTNKQLQQLLAQYPDNVPVRLLPKQLNDVKSIVDFTEENVLLTSEGAYVDESADPETWDAEDGKVTQNGERYLLINPIIY